MKEDIYQVIVEDNSRLGGSMGTETTNTILRVNFKDKGKKTALERAIDFVYEYGIKWGIIKTDLIAMKKEKFVKLSLKRINEIVGDLGNIGIEIKKLKIN